MKLDKRPDLIEEYVTRKKAEVLALANLLSQIARAPTIPKQGIALTGQRRIFMAIKGGTASHSSEQ